MSSSTASQPPAAQAARPSTSPVYACPACHTELRNSMGDVLCARCGGTVLPDGRVVSELQAGETIADQYPSDTDDEMEEACEAATRVYVVSLTYPCDPEDKRCEGYTDEPEVFRVKAHAEARLCELLLDHLEEHINLDDVAAEDERFFETMDSDDDDEEAADDESAHVCSQFRADLKLVRRLATRYLDTSVAVEGNLYKTELH